VTGWPNPVRFPLPSKSLSYFQASLGRDHSGYKLASLTPPALGTHCTSQLSACGVPGVTPSPLAPPNQLGLNESVMMVRCMGQGEEQALWAQWRQQKILMG